MKSLKKHLHNLKDYYIQEIDVYNTLLKNNPNDDYLKEQLLDYSNLLLELNEILNE